MQNQVLGAENIFECGDREAPVDNRYPLGEPRGSMTGSIDFIFDNLGCCWRPPSAGLFGKTCLPLI